MPRWRVLVRPVVTLRIAADPDDDVVIGTAQAGRADLIVSGDAHLLNLRIIDSFLL